MFRHMFGLHPAWRGLQHVLACNVRLPRTCLQAGAPDPDLEMVGLAVERRRGEAKRILAVQLVGDLRERRAQVVGGGEFEISPARGERDPRQPGIRLLELRWLS